MDSAQYEDHVLPSFFRFQVFVFKVLGSWHPPKSWQTSKRILHTLYYLFTLFFWFVPINLMMFLYAMTIISRGAELVKQFYMLGSILSVLFKFCSIRLKSAQGQELLDTVYNSSMFRPQNAHELKLLVKAADLARYIRNVYGFNAILTVNLMHAVRYNTSTYELPFDVYTPFAINANWRYVLIFFYEYFSITILALLNIAFDTITTSLLLYTKTQLDILASRLENIGANGSGVKTSVLFQLKEGVFLHREIWKWTNTIEKFVCLPFSTQMGFSTVALIANFYAISLLSVSEDFLEIAIFSIYQVCMLSQLFLFCYFANEVTSKSAELSHYLYGSEWYTWSKSDRKLALLMMQQFSTPIKIKSIISSYSFTLATFVSIVNSSYSYFALIKKING